MYMLQLTYNNTGRGNVKLIKDGQVLHSWPARCGSIDNTGKLAHATPPAVYKIKVPATFTENKAMQIGGIGWWCPLYSVDNYITHMGFHPDGGLGGTKGCIGTQEIALSLKNVIESTLREQIDILVDVQYNRGTEVI